MTRLTTVPSSVYRSVDYCDAVKFDKLAERWVGVDFCGYHKDWTGAACLQGDHDFRVDEASVTAAALRSGLGSGYLFCFLTDSDLALKQFKEPDEKYDLSLWILYHHDLRDSKRVTLFRKHPKEKIIALRPIFEGRGLENQSQISCYLILQHTAYDLVHLQPWSAFARSSAQ